MNPETGKSKYYVYGIWNNSEGALVIKDGKPHIIEFDNLQNALDEVSARVESNVNIMWGICRSEPKYYEMLTSTLEPYYKITCN